MKIESIAVYPLRIRRGEAYLGTLPAGATPEKYFTRPPYRSLYSAYFETAFVRITTDDGLVGWGEALAPVAPEVVQTIIEQLLSPVLIGRNPLDGGVLWNTMYDLMRERGYYGGFMLDAISACDIALWDLRGKILQQPLYQLLGGAYRDTIPCYVSGLPRPTDKERVELALEWTARGFNAIKLAAGYGVRQDAASMKALRDALGDEAELLLDAHWVYSLDESVNLGRRLEDLNAAVFEAPINPEDIDAHVLLAQALAVPVAIGETERTRYQFQPWLTRRGADLLQPDVGRTGVSELVKIAQMAETFNIPVAPHLSVGLGICISASIHIAAAIPNLYKLEYQPPVFELANHLLVEPLRCEQGRFHIPQADGLGIALDEQKIAALQA
jgi:L-alanine-DL-glutamate epimerase-like enolase superfamily enzyme